MRFVSRHRFRPVLYYIAEYDRQRRVTHLAEKTPAQKRAQKSYMEKFAVARVRMEPEKMEAVKAHAAKTDGGSVNAFINRAIDEAMEREGA